MTESVNVDKFVSSSRASSKEGVGKGGGGGGSMPQCGNAQDAHEHANAASGRARHPPRGTALCRATHHTTTHVPSSLVVMVPSPSLSNREKASLNSAICSSVNWSAIVKTSGSWRSTAQELVVGYGGIFRNAWCFYIAITKLSALHPVLRLRSTAIARTGCWWMDEQDDPVTWAGSQRF